MTLQEIEACLAPLRDRPGITPGEVEVAYRTVALEQAVRLFAGRPEDFDLDTAEQFYKFLRGVKAG